MVPSESRVAGRELRPQNWAGNFEGRYSETFVAERLTLKPASQAPYHISQITSPPNFCFLASLSVIKPFGVEIMAIPYPPLTLFIFRWLR